MPVLAGPNRRLKNSVKLHPVQGLTCPSRNIATEAPVFGYSQSFLTLVKSSFNLSITVTVLSTFAKSSVM